MDSSKYKELLELYRKKYGSNGEEVLRMHINSVRRELLVNEHTALEILYERIMRTTKLEVERTQVLEIEPGLKINIKYDGENFVILYLSITEFIEDLNLLGKALDYIENYIGEVLAVTNNLGITPTGFHGVKGFAIICKKRKI